MKTLLLAVGLLVPVSTTAAPAVRLVLSNNPCLAEPCPGPLPVPPTTTEAGVAFRIFVVAVDGDNAIDPGFIGTITFSSSDSLATLPSSYTFVPSDGGATGGGFTTILRTIGNQTITVTDAAGNLLSGSFVMTVTGLGPTESIPTASGWMKVLLGLTLASLGAWFVRQTS